jgi:hypothetical protein
MNRILLFVSLLSVLFLSILNKQDRKPTKQELINQWKLRDFYLVYQYYFDEDILKLRKELDNDPIGILEQSRRAL